MRPLELDEETQAYIVDNPLDADGAKHLLRQDYHTDSSDRAAIREHLDNVRGSTKDIISHPAMLASLGRMIKGGNAVLTGEEPETEEERESVEMWRECATQIPGGATPEMQAMLLSGMVRTYNNALQHAKSRRSKARSLESVRNAEELSLPAEIQNRSHDWFHQSGKTWVAERINGKLVATAVSPPGFGQYSSHIAESIGSCDSPEEAFGAAIGMVVSLSARAIMKRPYAESISEREAQEILAGDTVLRGATASPSAADPNRVEQPESKEETREAEGSADVEETENKAGNEASEKPSGKTAEPEHDDEYPMGEAPADIPEPVPGEYGEPVPEVDRDEDKSQHASRDENEPHASKNNEKPTAGAEEVSRAEEEVRVEEIPAHTPEANPDQPELPLTQAQKKVPDVAEELKLSTLTNKDNLEYAHAKKATGREKNTGKDEES